MSADTKNRLSDLKIINQWINHHVTNVEINIEVDNDNEAAEQALKKYLKESEKQNSDTLDLKVDKNKLLDNPDENKSRGENTD